MIGDIVTLRSAYGLVGVTAIVVKMAPNFVELMNGTGRVITTPSQTFNLIWEFKAKVDQRSCFQCQKAAHLRFEASAGDVRWACLDHFPQGAHLSVPGVPQNEETVRYCLNCFMDRKPLGLVSLRGDIAVEYECLACTCKWVQGDTRKIQAEQWLSHARAWGEFKALAGTQACKPLQMQPSLRIYPEELVIMRGYDLHDPHKDLKKGMRCTYLNEEYLITQIQESRVTLTRPEGVRLLLHPRVFFRECNPICRVDFYEALLEG